MSRIVQKLAYPIQVRSHEVLTDSKGRFDSELGPSAGMHSSLAIPGDVTPALPCSTHNTALLEERTL